MHDLRYKSLNLIFTGFLTITTATIAHADTNQANVNYDKLDRNSFNRLAQETNTPLFWRKDINNNNTIDPNQVLFLWGMRPDKQASDYVNLGKFTTQFDQAYQLMVRRGQGQEPGPDPATLSDPEQKRRALVVKEISQARPTLIESDFTKNSAEDRAVVQHLLKTAALVEEVYLLQKGVYQWDIKIPTDDTASHTLFYRNHGPFCLNPATENNPDCNALPDKPKRIVGVYPASLQQDQTFCEALQKRPDGKTLSNPFSTVVERNGQLTTIPYSVAYEAQMKQIANELKATAQLITDTKENAFKTYLIAAAKSFTDNNWYAADESWSKMNATNSKWYLRIGPDEQYWEPCSLKAGFHVTFAKINADSILWQEKLNPLKDEMENRLATMAGPPYQARKVNFHLPDFIDIVINAGDARSHAGGTMGQSLPNSGPVAEEGRGRTTVMANIIMPDEDSRAQYLKRASSLFCKTTMDKVVADPKLANMTTVLHEAAHNLGPAHEYKVAGKIDREIFGGKMASMLEELKAQTSALYLTDWLVSKKMIDQKTRDQAYLDSLLWAFGHISKGMYASDGSFKAYSQLAAIQFGSLVKGEAIVWLPEQMAANNTDKGCFEVDMDKFMLNVATLEKDVLRIKSTGDKARAEALKAEMVDNNASLKQLHAIITERVLRSPVMTFVYAVRQ